MSTQPPAISTKRTVKRFAPLSVGKIGAIIYGVFGLIAIPFLILGIVFSSNLPPEQRGFLGIVGIGFAVFLPLLYAVIGFIGGIISAAIYNLAAKWVGGIEVEVE